jgi:hypothetical protein
LQRVFLYLALSNVTQVKMLWALMLTVSGAQGKENGSHGITIINTLAVSVYLTYEVFCVTVVEVLFFFKAHQNLNNQF